MEKLCEHDRCTSNTTQGTSHKVQSTELTIDYMCIHAKYEGKSSHIAHHSGNAFRFIRHIDQKHLRWTLNNMNIGGIRFVFFGLLFSFYLVFHCGFSCIIRLVNHIFFASYFVVFSFIFSTNNPFIYRSNGEMTFVSAILD